jgi:hypothetical protein
MAAIVICCISKMLRIISGPARVFLLCRSRVAPDPPARGGGIGDLEHQVAIERVQLLRSIERYDGDVPSPGDLEMLMGHDRSLPDQGPAPAQSDAASEPGGPSTCESITSPVWESAVSIRFGSPGILSKFSHLVRSAGIDPMPAGCGGGDRRVHAAAARL